MSLATESTHLLHDIEGEDSSRPRSLNGSAYDEQWPASHKLTVALVTLVMISLEAGLVFINNASIDLYRTKVCNYYYSKQPDTISPDCYATEVTIQLSQVLTGYAYLRQIVGLLVILPYIAFIRRTGGRRLALLGIFGFALSCACFVGAARIGSISPLSAIFTSLLVLIGGGSPTISAVLLTMYASTIPASQRLNVFMGTRAAEMLPRMLTPLASRALLDRGLVTLTITTGFICFASATVFMYLVPVDEFKDQRLEVSNRVEGDGVATQWAQIARRSLLGWFTSRRNLNSGVIAVLCVLFATKIGRVFTNIIISTGPVKLHWTIAQMTNYQENIEGWRAALF